MRRIKKIFGVIIFVTILSGIVCVLLFTTCQVSGKRALVAKCFRKDYLRPGDLLQINPDLWTTTQPVVCRLERVIPPDDAKRIRVSRRIAQSIVDMDFKPTYSVTLLNEETNNAAMTINERQIRGKVIKVF
jgi:hypothetical protein